MNRVEVIEEKKIVGARIFTALAFNEAEFLWTKFRPLEKEIENRKSEVLYSIQNFPKGLSWSSFNANTLFEKWAGVEVESCDNLPFGLLELRIPAGKYIVFEYIGNGMDYGKFFSDILLNKLPSLNLDWDDRPQFEVMKPGEYFGPEDPNSKEEVWIPIK
jgi:AraC family transcriptional regulator